MDDAGEGRCNCNALAPPNRYSIKGVVAFSPLPSVATRQGVRRSWGDDVEPEENPDDDIQAQQVQEEAADHVEALAFARAATSSA